MNPQGFPLFFCSMKPIHESLCGSSAVGSWRSRCHDDACDVTERLPRTPKPTGRVPDDLRSATCVCKTAFSPLSHGKRANELALIHNRGCEPETSANRLRISPRVPVIISPFVSSDELRGNATCFCPSPLSEFAAPKLDLWHG